MSNPPTATAEPSVTPVRGPRLSRTARRTQLLNAAREVFVASGYHSAAMDEIADHAGVSKPVLYQHFPGKRDLYLAVLDQHIDELQADIREALASSTDNQQRVTATIRAYFSFASRPDSPCRLVFESDMNRDKGVQERIDRCLGTCSKAIATVIREETGLPMIKAELLGVALTGMATATARFWTGLDDEIPRQEAEQLVSQLSWRGLGDIPLTPPDPAPGASGNYTGGRVG